MASDVNIWSFWGLVYVRMLTELILPSNTVQCNNKLLGKLVGSALQGFRMLIDC